MTYEIIPIKSITLADGTITVSGIFWLQAPPTLIVQQPQITSQFKLITASQLSALQNGTIVEVPFNTGLYPAGTSNDDIFTDLQSQYATAQTNLNNSAPVSSGLIGVVFDGYNWVTPTSPIMPSTQQVSLFGVPNTSDGRIRIASEKSSLNKLTIYSPNYCDQTTWYPSAAYIVNEVVSRSSDGYYHLAHNNIIDSYHGKISDEDFLVGTDGYSLRVTVIQDGYTMTEQDPHFATGGDYTIDYATGIIYPITLTSDLLVTYHYANGSTFTIIPPTGMALIIDSAECEFSTDIILTDTVEFILMGYASVFAPQLGLPVGYRIPLSTTKYKTMTDYYNDAVKSYPTYPPMGGPGWRGVHASSTVLNWDYISATAISSILGMQIVIKLEHDTVFGGSYATTTFFTIIEPDPNT